MQPDPVDSAQHWLDRSAALMKFMRDRSCVIAFDEGVWGFKANFQDQLAGFLQRSDLNPHPEEMETVDSVGE